MSITYEQLVVSRESAVALIQLNRPERLNAISVQMAAELSAALEAIASDSSVRVLILSAVGQRAFCSGADLKERSTMSADERWAHNRALNQCANQLARLQIPTLAAVNGLAFGGGCELIVACDVRIATDHARFALPEVGLGIIPGAGGTQRLPRLIGQTRAKQLIFTAQPIDAATALEWGLISQVTTTDELLPSAFAFAAQIAKHSPLALAYAKAAIEIGLESSLEQGQRYETAAIRATLAAEDYQIGLRAFQRKEEPEFPALTAKHIV